MNIWASFPFVRFLIFFLSGILIADFFTNPYSIYALYGASGGLYMLIRYISTKRQNLKFRSPLAIIGFMHLFFFGLIISHLHSENRKDNHLIHTTKKIQAYTVVIDTKIKDNSYIVTIDKYKTEDLNWVDASGKILLNIKDRENKLNPGEYLLINSHPKRFSGTNIPYAFDQKKYWANKNVYHYDFLIDDNIFLLEEYSKKTWSFFLSQIRNKCKDILNKNLPSDVKALAEALLIGDKTDLDQGLKSQYAHTGAIHVLAVSGLHTGIIFLVAAFLLRFLKDNARLKILYPISVCLILLFYAMLTGLSPSVLRASFMFSLYIFGITFFRNTSIYNTIAISAFILLIYNPKNIYEPGFQLSYLAVIGIVAMASQLKNKLVFKNKILDYTWGLITVSIAAQIATAPLSIYYFHLFPNYFLLTNIFVIPLTFLIVSSGFLLLVISLIAHMPEYLFSPLSYLLKFQNFIIESISKLPGAVTENLFLNNLQIVVLFTMTTTLVFISRHKKVYFLIAFLWLTITSSEIYKLHSFAHQKRLIVYNIMNHPAIVLAEGNEAIILTDEYLIKKEKTMIASIGNHLKSLNLTFKTVSLEKDNAEIAISNINDNYLLVWRNKSILLSSKQNPIDLNPDFLIVYDDKKLDFNKKTQIITLKNKTKEYVLSAEEGACIINL